MFVPDVTFRSLDNYIEISWDNTSLFEDDEINYVNIRGFKLVDKQVFEEIVKKLIFEYKKIL